MESSPRPDLALARKVLPKPLLQALSRIFSGGLSDCVLVGGSALSGFYAGHRRSDDLDLVTRDPANFKAVTLAAKQLPIDQQHASAMYFRANCTLAGHAFTIDVVQDPNFFQVGRWHQLENDITVASLDTLLMCKAATLVSRAGEKDLYDLIWLFDRFPEIDLSRFLQLGQEIDAGLNAESVLLSLAGAILKEEACDFSLDPGISKKQIYARIKSFRKQLLRELKDIKKVETPPGLAEIVKRIKEIGS